MPHVLRFKFRATSDLSAREDLVEKVLQQGDVEVGPLFPDETDAELATLYTARCENPKLAATLAEALRRSPLIEYVEGEVKRKLIR